MANWQRATSSSEKYSDPIPVKQCALKLTSWYSTATSSEEPLDTKPKHSVRLQHSLHHEVNYMASGPSRSPAYPAQNTVSSEKSCSYYRVAFCFHFSVHIFHNVSGHSLVYPQLETSLGRNMG